MIPTAAPVAASGATIQVLDRRRYEVIERLADAAASFAASAAEASYRNDGKEVWVNLFKSARTLSQAIKTAEALGRDVEADQ
jgi:hypothetical protein